MILDSLFVDLDEDDSDTLSIDSSESYSYWFEDFEHPESSVEEEWEAIERMMYDEPGPYPQNSIIVEECRLWKESFPYLRIIGHQLSYQELRFPSEEKNEAELITYTPNILSIVSSKREKIKKQVVTHIVNQIQTKLHKNKDNQRGSAKYNRIESGQTSAEVSKTSLEKFNKPDAILQSPKVKVKSKKINQEPSETKREENTRIKTTIPRYNINDSSFCKNLDKILIPSQSEVEETRLRPAQKTPKSPDKNENEVDLQFPRNKIIGHTTELKPILRNSNKNTERKLRLKSTESTSNVRPLSRTNLTDRTHFKNNEHSKNYTDTQNFELKNDINFESSSTVPKPRLPKMNFENNWMDLSKHETDSTLDEFYEKDFAILKKYGKVNGLVTKTSKSQSINSNLKCESQLDSTLSSYKRGSILHRKRVEGMRIQSSRETEGEREVINCSVRTYSSKPRVKPLQSRCLIKGTCDTNKSSEHAKVKLPPLHKIN